MTYKYEIWLNNLEPRTVSIFVNDKEHIYEVPSKCFEIYMNNGVAIRFIIDKVGLLSTGNTTPTVYRYGATKWVKFESNIKLEWIVLIPMQAQPCVDVYTIDDD